jgi:hypothetical protein
MSDLGQPSVLEIIVIETTEVLSGGSGKTSGDLVLRR